MSKQVPNANQVQICAIAGGSGAGKTTLALKLLDRLGSNGAHFTIDWYYRDLSHLSADERAAVNFDHPDSLEVELFADHLRALAQGNDIEAPVYDFASHTRSTTTRPITHRPVVVTEGIHLLGLDAVRSLCTVAVFIDVAPEVRLARRVRRDIAERGRTERSVREQWATTVAPMHEQFVQPSMANADRIVTEAEDLDLVADELAALLTRTAP